MVTRFNARIPERFEPARGIVLNAVDNVATMLDDISRGTEARLVGAMASCVGAVEDVPYGHKLALQPIHRGQDILKYGQVIGRATMDIPKGAHVHVHNVESLRGRGDLVTGVTS